MKTKISKNFFLRLMRLGFCMVSVMSTGTVFAQSHPYEGEVGNWTSYEDVAKWLRSNFKFDLNRQSQVQRQLKETGPENILTRKPENLYAMKAGYCRDAAGFARDALNRINPRYDAKYIFIKNKTGLPNHWVTGFHVNGRIYVMDYGAGHHWQDMMGVHGPYDSLEGYKSFLSSLYLKGFAVGEVKWRDLQGTQD